MEFKLIIRKDLPESVTVTVHAHSPLADKIERLVKEDLGLNELTVQGKNSLKIISFDDIECVTVIGGKTFVRDLEGEMLEVRKRLYELEELLPSSFIRINKSSIANKKRLDRFTAGYSGSVNAVFKSGYTDYVSRRCFSKIKKEF